MELVGKLSCGRFCITGLEGTKCQYAKLGELPLTFPQALKAQISSGGRDDQPAADTWPAEVRAFESAGVSVAKGLDSFVGAASAAVQTSASIAG